MQALLPQPASRQPIPIVSESVLLVFSSEKVYVFAHL
jgi:hypothetical protein